jgi:hypothetical protein
MHEFKPHTERIGSIREKIRNRVIRGDAERTILKLEALKKYENMIPIIRNPLITLDIYSKITLRIEDDDFYEIGRAHV